MPKYHASELKPPKQKPLLNDDSLFDNEPELECDGGKSSFCGLRRSAPKVAQRDPAELANQAYVHMLEFNTRVKPGLQKGRRSYGGLVWQNYESSDPKTSKRWEHPRNYQGVVDNTSMNIGVPYPIDELESQFLERFKNSEFYAVHFGLSDFRRKNGDVTFLSAFSLLKKNMGEDNTDLGTITEEMAQYGTDDFAFFSLEIGGVPKKESSRFGTHKYRVPFDVILEHPYGRRAAAQLNDIMNFQRRSNNDLPKWLTSNSDAMMAYKKPVATREAEILYTADKLKEGIGIRLLQDLREFPSEVRQQALSSSSDAELDTLMNKFYRPQILVPKGLSLNKSQYEYSAPTS